jgi:thioredoxin reductase/SAM-dependent methyltransferase
MATTEVIVVGGGAAGLSAALTLGRARRSVLVLDAGRPRNAPAAGVHTFLSREGVAPLDLLAIGRREVESYGARIVPALVTRATPTDDGFRVFLEDGSAHDAARLILATGLVDELPGVPGLAERFGADVLHCPYCHGWEVRDRRIGVLGTGPLSVHQALLWRQWSADVTLFLNDTVVPGEPEREQLAARGVVVVEGRVTGFEGPHVRTSGGPATPVDALAVATGLTARPLPGLGLNTTPVELGGHVVGSAIAADPTGATDVPGVWVAGNVTSVLDQVVAAAAAGVRAGAAVNADLIAAETRRAVTLRRTPGSEYWEARYGGADPIWSGKPNATLVREAADLPAGHALELGCGEGADAVWLAGRGWRVTAVDIARAALDRGAAAAAAAGVADRIDWQRHDLGESFPAGTFDLVTASFLHTHDGAFPVREVRRAAARAVAPGGVLLLVGHSTGHHHQRFETPAEILAGLDPAEGEWDVLICGEYPHDRVDNVLKLRRRAPR